MDWSAYLHPIVGAVVVGLVFSLGSLGLQARRWPRRRAEFLRYHARLGPWVCAAAFLTHASGMMAVLWGRTDLALTRSAHFRTGSLLCALLLLLFLTRPFLHLRQVRQLHPWVGALALLVAGAHVFFGLQLTR
ncbi:MAG: hypothetical protein KatS3mg077_1847 [Candidatus Binatia bacterium]|nr:MAG: hypothetical protein KatS3mg077_1847 [Candidatus Binatia bacterium]